jgi:PAS domain S-box-containing protein
MRQDESVNILMVDDQPAKLLSYEVMLAELGENLIKAASAKEALEILLKTDIAVVLMDVSMPDLDGFELATMIRQHPRFQRTAIIFISAVHLTDLDRLKGYEHGAVDYISVPVIQELLRAKVRVFAELHRKTRQLEELNRDLERRVLQRTEELETKAQALSDLNLELAEKNLELDAIVHTAPDIIFSRQPDGARDYISDRFYEYSGAATGSAVGFGWWDYLHADDRERSRQRWLDCVQSGENYEVEYRLRGKDGDYRWFRARAVPIRDQIGKIVRWYGTCSDIHDSKLLEQSIRTKCFWRSLLNRRNKHGFRPVLLSIARFRKCVPCPTFCILPYSMKLGCSQPWRGMWRDSQKGAESKHVWMFSLWTSRAFHRRWRRRFSELFKRDSRMCSGILELERCVLP